MQKGEHASHTKPYQGRPGEKRGPKFEGPGCWREGRPSFEKTIGGEVSRVTGLKSWLLELNDAATPGSNGRSATAFGGRNGKPIATLLAGVHWIPSGASVMRSVHRIPTAARPAPKATIGGGGAI